MNYLIQSNTKPAEIVLKVEFLSVKDKKNAKKNNVVELIEKTAGVLFNSSKKLCLKFENDEI